MQWPCRARMMSIRQRASAETWAYNNTQHGSQGSEVQIIITMRFGFHARVVVSKMNIRTMHCHGLHQTLRSRPRPTASLKLQGFRLPLHCLGLGLGRQLRLVGLALQGLGARLSIIIQQSSEGQMGCSAILVFFPILCVPQSKAIHS
jgi:hypothetical protein